MKLQATQGKTDLWEVIWVPCIRAVPISTSKEFWVSKTSYFPGSLGKVLRGEWASKLELIRPLVLIVALLLSCVALGMSLNLSEFVSSVLTGVMRIRGKVFRYIVG
jgi:hypothetical protein